MVETRLARPGNLEFIHPDGSKTIKAVSDYGERFVPAAIYTFLLRYNDAIEDTHSWISDYVRGFDDKNSKLKLNSGFGNCISRAEIDTMRKKIYLRGPSSSLEGFLGGIEEKALEQGYTLKIDRTPNI